MRRTGPTKAPLLRHPWRTQVELPPSHRLVRKLELAEHGMAPDATVLLERPPAIRRLARALATLVVVVLIVYLWPVTLGGKSSLVIVSGSSMEPTMHTGDLVLMRSTESYDIGDVAMYAIPEDEPGAGARVIHRVVDIGDNGVYVFRGDNRSSNDGWHPRASDIVGRRALLIPRLGSLLMQLRNPLAVGLLAGVLVSLFSWPWKRGRGLHAELPWSPECLTTPVPGPCPVPGWDKVWRHSADRAVPAMSSPG